MGEEQQPKTVNGDEEKQLKTVNGDEEKQPEAKDKQLESRENDNDAIDPSPLDRTTSCFSVATSPSPSPRSSPRWSMMSASPRSAGITSQLSFPENPPLDHDPDVTASPRQPPSPQCGDHPPGYDPKRIPSSIFSSKSGNGEDWSAASNESLFSIHVGNGSFTNGEVSDRKSLSSLCPLAEASPDSDVKDWKMSDVSQVKGIVETAKSSSGNATPSSQAFSPSPRNPNAPQIPTIQSPRNSTGSVNSCQSFAFPVLVKDVSKNPASQPLSAPQPEPPPQLETPPTQPDKEAAPPETPKEMSKAAEPGCFTCFSCLPRCC